MSGPLPDKLLITEYIDTVLGWDPEGENRPGTDAVLPVVEQLTEYGRVIADDLRTLALSIRADSDAGVAAQAALGEATRRLHLPPPVITPYSTIARAKNLARLVRALLRAADGVMQEHARTRNNYRSL